MCYIATHSHTHKCKNISRAFGMLAQMENVSVGCNASVTGEKLVGEKCLVIELAAVFLYISSNIYL